MRQKTLLTRLMLLLLVLVGGVGTAWADTYEQLTSISSIDESAEYVLGIDGTGFHYEGISSWGKTALPSAQTPLKYTLTKAKDGESFTAKTTISGTTYYLQIPTTNTFSMATTTGTNTDIIIGTTQVSGTNYAVANKTTTARHLRINGTSGLRSYAGTTGTMAFFYKVIPAFTITAESNNISLGTVSVSGNKITATPSNGCRVSKTTPYEVISGTATVTQEENVFTVTTSAACTIRINFEEGSAYTVYFNEEGGSCETSSLTEEAFQSGITLPSATISHNGWIFAGWATTTISNTTTRPTLYTAGDTYYPTENITLHAVYKIDGIDDSKYKRATSLEDIISANSFVFVNSNKVLDHAYGSVDAPTESAGKITPSDSYVWEKSGDNVTGFTITGTGTMGIASLPSSSANVSNTNSHNKWLFANTSYGENLFVLRNTELNGSGYVLAIEYTSSKWKAYAVSSSTYMSTNSYVPSKIYIPIENAYNSNPAGAIVDPVVAFEKEGTTLYLDGTTTYTNAATVTGIDKTATYTSSDESVATVDANGNVTAVGIGTATITASVAQELGVNNAASATYEIVVKSATTIAGIKNITDASGAVNFTADLTDAVVTYVKDGHAYIQDATAAIYASCGSDLTAGQKINGAVSGSVKAAYKIDEITSIDLDEATVTNDGVIPAAEVETLAEIKAAGTGYDGKLVTVNAATVSNSMANTANSGASISDDNGTTSFNLYAPNTGITVNASEIGNFTGFVSIYNGTTYRLNLYEQSQIVLTQNAARDQELSFDEDEIVLDEETTEFDNFIGQAVEGAQGTVTYTISDDVIGTVDNDGIVVLNGTCGTATVTANAAAITKEIDGIPTPYKAATKSYTITVRPRYTVTFAINGIETEVREASFGVGVTAPTPAQIGEYSFVGWSTTEVATTDEEPTMVTVAKPSSNSEKYYAVFAKETIGNPETITLASNNGSNATTNSITFAGTTNDNNGNSAPSFNLSKTLTISGIDLTDYSDVSVSFDYKVGKSGSTYTTFNVEQFNSSNSSIGNTPVTGTNNNGWDNSNVSLNAACVKIVITSSGFTSNCYIDNIIITGTRPSITYAGYTTNPTQIAFGGSPESNYTFATFSSEQAVVFTGDVEVFTVTVDDANNLVKSELTQGDYFVENEGVVENGYYVPANTGVMLRGTANSYNYHIAATTEDVTIPTNMLIAGTDAVPTETDYKYYKLTYEDASHQHIGFYWGAAEGAPFMTKKGKAYLRLPKSVPARGFSLFDDDNTTTGISTMHNSEFIMHNEVYNLNGQRVDNLKKGGLYIVNGKKMVIK